MVEILRKTRTEVADLAVRVTGEQDEDPPWTFREVHLHFTFRGTGIDPAVVERAVRLSVDKYCSVIATVRARGGGHRQLRDRRGGGRPVA